MSQRRTIPRILPESSGLDRAALSLPEKARRLWNSKYRQQWLACTSATITMGLVGTVHGWTKTSLVHLTSGSDDVPLTLTQDEYSWVVSLTVLSSMIASLVAAQLADRSGRKFCLILCSTMFTLGWFIIYVATLHDVPLLYLAGVIHGIGVGIAHTINPMFVSEVTDIKYRGSISVLIAANVYTGSLLTYALEHSLTYTSHLVALIAISSISILPLMCLRETPYFLVAKGQRAQARESIAYYKGIVDPERVKIELRALRAEARYGLHQQSRSDLSSQSGSDLQPSYGSNESPPYSIDAPPPSSTDEPPPYRIDAPPPSSIDEPPPYRIDAPPPYRIDAPPPSSIDEPPPYSFGAPPPYSIDETPLCRTNLPKGNLPLSNDLPPPYRSNSPLQSIREEHPDHALEVEGTEATSDLHLPTSSESPSESISSVHSKFKCEVKTQPTGELRVEYSRDSPELPLQISRELHSQSTSEEHPPSTSEVHLPSTIKIQRPSTSEVHRSSTSEVHPPSTSEIHRPSTSEVHPPSTSEVHPPSTSEVHPPSTSELHTQSTSELHSQSASEIHPPSTSELHSQSTSEVHRPSASEVHRKPTSEIHRLSTTELPSQFTSELHRSSASQIDQPYTSQIDQPSASEIHRQSTSEEHPPPTSAVHPPSTSEVHRPSTSEKHSQYTSEVHRPSTSKIHQPSTSEVHPPSTSEVHRSSTTELPSQFTSELHRSSASQIDQPYTSQIDQPSTSEIHRQSTSEEHPPPTSAVHPPSASEIHRPPTSELHSQSTSELHTQSTSELHSQSASEIHPPSTSELHSQSTSEVHRPSASEVHRKPTSEIHRLSTSEIHRPSTSEIHRPSTSEIHRPSTSNIHRPSTSEINPDHICEIQSRPRSVLRTQPNVDSRASTVISESYMDATRYTFLNKLRAILQRSNMKALFIMLGLIVAQQFSGNFTAMQHLQKVINSKITSIDLYKAMILAELVRVFSGYLSVSLAKRYGRRRLLITSICVSSGIRLALIICLWVTKHRIDSFIVFAIFVLILILCQGFFQIGLGTLPNTLLCELFPTKLKGIVAAILVIFDGTIGLIGSLLHQAFPDILVIQMIYLLSGISLAIASYLVLKFVPETKGKTYYEIEALLAGENLNSLNEQVRTDEMDISRI